ncbi:MAG: cyclodeaminase/cyclohydrolase family protein [Planctomycetota bacterium]
MPSFSDQTIQAFVESAASRAPAPGGGAINALVAALGAAAAEMAIRFSDGKDYDASRALLSEAAHSFASIRSRCLELMDADADSFKAVADAYALPKSTSAEKTARRDAIQRALIEATRTPTALLDAADMLSLTAERIASVSNPQLIADIAVGALAASAAARGALLNIEENLRGDSNATARKRAAQKTDEIVARSDAVYRAARERIGSTL